MNRIMGQGKAFMPLRLDVGLKKRGVEAEIDARVAHLYELTEEEYSLILSESKPPATFRVAVLNFYRDIARGVLK